MSEKAWHDVLIRDTQWQALHEQAKLCETPTEKPATP